MKKERAANAHEAFKKIVAFMENNPDKNPMTLVWHDGEGYMKVVHDTRTSEEIVKLGKRMYLADPGEVLFEVDWDA